MNSNITRWIGLTSLCFIAFVFAPDARAASAGNQNRFEQITLTKVESPNIKIDGVLDEAIWKTLPSATGPMVVVQPDSMVPAGNETRTYLFYTKEGLYVGIWAEQDPETLIARLSSRDQFISRDGVSLTLDPSGKGLYGYWFATYLGGSIGDGTVVPERQYSRQWDGPWYGETAVHDQGYSAEMFIPWSTMTMPDTNSSERIVGYSLTRTVGYNDQHWAYPPLSRRENVFLSQLPTMALESISPKQQYTFYPFVSSSYDNTMDQNQDSYKAGFDLFWRPTSNLQLTATVNPDFGNVESDKVDVNLSSFETFFPEKRAFFLEGQEIFITTPRASGRDGTPTTLLNTRRIGSAPKDPLILDFELEGIEANQPSELEGAGKITGQNGKLRYGFLAAIEDDTKLSGELSGQPLEVLQDGRQFSVARLLYEDTSTGDRRSIGWMSTNVAHTQEDATVHGIDGHYLTADGRWNTDAQIMYSDVNNVTGQGAFVDVTYTPQRGRSHKLSMDYYDDTLDINDFGFLRRNDNIAARYRYDRNDSNLVDLRSRTTTIKLVQEYNTAGRLVRSGAFWEQKFEFQNNNFMSYQLNYFPERWEDRESDEGDYRVEGRWLTGAFAKTNQSKPLSIGGGVFYRGEQLGGYTMEYVTELDWRPTDRFSLTAKLVYEDKSGWLLHDDGRDFTTFNAIVWRPEMEMDFFITAKQQIRITAQWAGIKSHEDERWKIPLGDGELITDPVPPGDSSRDFNISRLTFQARYRWQIAPLSDLFLVYTRGSNVNSMPDDDFDDLLSSAWTDRLVDIFVIKLRYRLGS